LPPRRQFTLKHPRATAGDLPIAPKTIELEQRIARVEGWCEELQQTVDVVLKRVNALQAQLDHISARLLGLR